jgi:quinol monooxygenase YgiN
MPQVSIVAVVTPRPGAEAALEAELLSLVAPSRAEAGCVRYDLLRDPSQPGTLVFLEDWKDLAAHLEHKQTPHFLASRARQEGLVANREVRLLEAVG